MAGLLNLLKQLFDSLGGAPFLPTSTVAAHRREFWSRVELEKMRPQLTQLRDKYVALKQLTTPCDRPAAERAIRGLYRAIGLETPSFLWFASPMAAAKASILWNVMTASFKIAQPDGENRLVFDPTAIAMQTDALRDDNILSLMHVAAIPTEPRIVRERRVSILMAFEFLDLEPRHDDIIMRHLDDALSRRWYSTGSVLDEWLGTWQALSEALKQNDPVLARKHEAFADIFWALSDNEQETLLRRSALHEFNGSGFFAARDSIWWDPRARRTSSGNSDSMRAFLMEAMHVFGEKPTEAFYKYRETTVHCGWWRPYRDVCFMIERPEELVLDEFGAPHRFDAPAVRYRDGFEVYAVNGIEVRKQIALGEFGARDIDLEQNLEVRRVMIDRFGAGRYLKETGAAEIDRDECGVLYAKDVRGDEPIYMVKVVNSSPEPDGSFKEYYLRVPPDIRTARAAVAWTFDMESKDYQPQVET